MGKQLRETLVGIFIIVGIMLFIVLYTWLSGRIGLRNTRDVVVYFDEVTGLRVGDPVLVYGLEKGKIKSLAIDGSRVRAVLALDRSITLPEDSDIAIRSVSYVGSDRYVKITPGTAGKTADVYYGRSEALDLESAAAQFDTLMSMIKKFNPEEFNFEKIADKLSHDLNRNINALTGMMREPTEKIQHAAERMDSLSKRLSELVSGDGTVGKLLTSDELYEEIRATNQAVQDLVQDIKENPKKYINIKVF
jgi:phospholipid/cholesterol/gamma-HCH transport system substrate-binding protein